MGSHPYQVPQKAKNTAYCKMYAHCIRPENRFNSVLQVHKLWVEIKEHERKQACTHLSETMGLKWNSVLMFVKCNTKRQIFLIQNSHFRNRTNKQTKNYNHDSQQCHIFCVHFIFKEEFSNHLSTCTCVEKHIYVLHNSHCWFKSPQWEVRGRFRPKEQMFLNSRTWETACFLHLTNRCVQKCSTRVKYKATHLGFRHVKGLTRDGFAWDTKWWLDEKTWQFDAPLKETGDEKAWENFNQWDRERGFST